MSKYYNIDDRNAFEYEYTRIKDYHDLGYYGRNVKIAVLDDYGENAGDGKKPYHGNKTYDMLKMIAPESTIHMYTFDEVTKISSGYHIINVSAEVNIIVQNELQKLAEKGVIVICGVGNDDDDGESLLAQQEWAFSVGAVYTDYSDDIKVKSYSSHGFNVVDCMSFTDIYLPNGLKYTGTSCSTPYTTGLIALFLQHYMTKNRKLAEFTDIVSLVNNHCEDILDSGYDELSGNGVLRLPLIEEEFKPYNQHIAMVANKNIMVANDEVITIDTIPVINEDDRMVCPARYIAENMWARVDWVIIDNEVYAYIDY